MKQWIVLFTCIGFFILACGNGDHSANAEELAEGKVIFEKYCVACHGKKGELGMNGAKKFTASTMSVGERILVIKEGRNMMTPFKGMLKEEEIKAVAAYTMELSKID